VVRKMEAGPLADLVSKAEMFGIYSSSQQAGDHTGVVMVSAMMS
jgi:hypothetical protein